MDADDINRTTDLPALLGWRAQGRRRWLSGPCPFCGGKDRFVLKQTSEGWRWYCRGCGDGRYHTPLDFIMRLENLTFREALARLGGDLGRSAPKPPEHKPPEAQVTAPPDDWQAQAQAQVRRAALRLTPDSPGGQYLLGRGLLPATWAAWGLGEEDVYDPKAGRKRRAVLIPNTDKSGRILGIKYRFIDNAPDGLRYISLRGSQVLPFGLARCTPGRPGRPSPRTLLVVEGELNALSVWQCLLPDLDVVSTGSQETGETGLRLLAGLAKRYAQVVVWLDEGDRAKALALALGAKRALRSPLKDGDKLDANALLQRNGLREFLRLSLGMPDESAHLEVITYLGDDFTGELRTPGTPLYKLVTWWSVAQERAG